MVARFGGTLALLLIVAASAANATTTICPDAAFERYHYGTKAKMNVRLSPSQADTFHKMIDEYASKNGFYYSSSGLLDPDKKPPLKKLTQFVQSKSFDVTITVRTSNRDSVARLAVDTFSYSCTATEDWMPYWRDFVSFITAHGYQQAPE
jgi:hypothetical protein